MDNNTIVSLLALIVSIILLCLTFYDRLFKKAKCLIEVEASSFSKKEDRWKVYIRLNIHAKNKPITLTSISLTKIFEGKRWYITQFERAYNGDAFAQAKNDFLIPNKILQPDTHHRIILETRFIPNAEVPAKYGWEETGWILSIQHNTNVTQRVHLNMRISGKDKYMEKQKTEIKN